MDTAYPRPYYTSRRQFLWWSSPVGGRGGGVINRSIALMALRPQRFDVSGKCFHHRRFDLLWPVPQGRLEGYARDCSEYALVMSVPVAHSCVCFCSVRCSLGVEGEIECRRLSTTGNLDVRSRHRREYPSQRNGHDMGGVPSTLTAAQCGKCGSGERLVPHPWRLSARSGARLLSHPPCPSGGQCPRSRSHWTLRQGDSGTARIQCCPAWVEQSRAGLPEGWRATSRRRESRALPSGGYAPRLRLRRSVLLPAGSQGRVLSFCKALRPPVPESCLL